MSEAIKTGGVHHVALTVSDVRRSQAFYMEVLGFKHLVDFGPRVLLQNGSVVLGMGPASDPSQAIAGYAGGGRGRRVGARAGWERE